MSEGRKKQSGQLLNTFDVLIQCEVQWQSCKLKNKLTTSVNTGSLLYCIVTINHGEMCREDLTPVNSF